MIESETLFRDRGACREKGVDPRIFFPTGNSSELSQARKVCGRCPVTKECLEFALKYGEDGVWGGTSERERRGMTRRMMLSVVAS